MISDKQRLMVGLGTAKAEAMNGLRAEVDFATNEAMVPSSVDEEAAGEKADSAFVIGAADEDDLGVSASRQAIWRPREARWCSLLPFLGFDVMGGDEAVRTVAQLGAAGVVKAIPDLNLPQVVEGLDLVLDAMLARWGEDGGDAQGQAEEGDGTETIRMVMGAVEAEVVVELSVGGQAVGSPVGQQRILSELGRDGGGEESAAKAAVQGDAVEDLDLADVLDDESLDDIEGVQLDAGRSEFGEMPTRRRWGSAEATGTADQAVSLEDVGDGGAAGQRLAGRGLGTQGAEDGDRTVFAQGVAMAESVPQGQNAVNHLAGQGRGSATRAARLVLKLDAVQTLAEGVMDPVLDVRESEPELAGDLAQGHPAPSQADQFASMLWREFFMLATLVAARIDVSSVPAPLRSASTTLTSMRETPEAIKVPK